MVAVMKRHIYGNRIRLGYRSLGHPKKEPREGECPFFWNHRGGSKKGGSGKNPETSSARQG
jgi:hypothetical protein